MTEQSPDRAASSAGVAAAARKIARILPPSPLLPLEVDGRTIWCKAECLQPIGAFKLRGAWHRLSDLSAEQRERGVVAFSSGNHAQGIAWAAQRLKMPATIVMPVDAPAAKVDGTRALGGEVVLYDRLSQSREVIAAYLAEERGAVLVPSFDDPWVIEGQGSLAIEAGAQLEALTGRRPDQYIVCCGGGGLAAGIALGAPDAAITIVEPDGWDDMARSLALGHIVPVGDNPPLTICDAIQTPRVAERTFRVLADRGAGAASVSDGEIAAAIRVAFARLHLVLEPGGAAALAAVLAGKVPLTEATVVTLSGGNVDPDLFAWLLTEPVPAPPPTAAAPLH